MPHRLWAAVATVALHAAVMALVLADRGSHLPRVADAQGLAIIMPLPARHDPARMVVVQSAGLQWRPPVAPALPPLDPAPLPPGEGRESSPDMPSGRMPPEVDAGVPAAAAPASRSQGLEDALVAYAQRLWTHIRTHRSMGIRVQGSAEVAFRIDRQGRLLGARLTRSSGVPLLDRLALRTVRAASPFPAPPQEVPDARLEFTVPINFL